MALGHSPSDLGTVDGTDSADAEGLDQSVGLADSASAQQLVGHSSPVAQLRVDQHVGTATGSSVIGVQVTVTADHELELDPSDVAEIAKRFVTPLSSSNRVGFDRVRTRLLDDDGRILVIVGDEGSGRTTAAKALLASVVEKRGASCAHLPLGGANHFPKRRLAVRRRCALLLHLPTDEEEFRIADRFGAEISEASPMLRENDCYLVVITTREQWLRISLAAAEQNVWYSQVADPLEITKSWLGGFMSPTLIARWMTDLRIKALVEGQSAQDAVEIAGLIREAAATPLSALEDVDLVSEESGGAALQSADGEFNHRVLSVVAARSSWRKQLLNWHTQPGRTAFERNFMLVVAVLPAGTDVSVAYGYAQSLSARFGESLQESKGQQGPGVIAMAQAIGARLAINRAVVFTKPGWADAVVRYFWIDRPDLTKVFVNWLAEVPLAGKNRDRAQSAGQIGERIIRLTAAERDIGPLTILFKSWSRDRGLWDAAAELAAKAAEIAVLEQLLHGEVLAWAKSPDKLLRRLVVELCAGRYGSAFPEKALVRLNHAATDDDPELEDAVIRAIDRLWQIPSMQATVFKRLAGWTKLKNDSRAGKARRTFARLAELPIPEGARPLLLEPSTDGDKLDVGDLVQGWRSLLQHNPDLAAHPLMRWMDTAVDAPEACALIFKILRTAVDVREHENGPDALHHLHLLVRDWERARRASAKPDESARIAKDLGDAIDEDWKSYLLRHHAVFTTTMNGSGESR